MRTKEIDVKLYEPDLKLLDHRGMPVYDKDHLMINEKHFRILNAKLLIELPERKVEITEGQFDEAWENVDCNDYPNAQDMFERMKEILFKEQA